jgi:energy-coupling factor transporter ATP-binding protein EcfA2
MKNSKFKYFTQLEVENVRVFGKKQVLKLADDNFHPTQWTLLLGDNGVGKTTLLECFGWLEPDLASLESDDVELITVSGIDEQGAYITSLEAHPNGEASILVPYLQNEADNDFLKVLVKYNQSHLTLTAGISNGEHLTKPPVADTNNATTKFHPRETIVTKVEIGYQNGRLSKYHSQGSSKIEASKIDDFIFPFLIVYGANRYVAKGTLSEKPFADESTTARLMNKTRLADAEVILQRLDYTALKTKTTRDKGRLNDALLVTARVLQIDNPKKDIRIQPPPIDENTPPERAGVWVKWFSGWVPLTEISLGYKTTLSLSLDLAWRLFQKFPNSKNPLDEPAIIVIDELDLHLHPKWQLNIMDDFSELFPAVQFIATAHSPLVVQSSPTANFAVLRKQGDEIVINNDPSVVNSWRADQILNSELFGLKASRNKQTSRFFEDRDRLLNRPNRTREEEMQLRQLETKILSLPTATNLEDEQAMKLIREAAQLLKGGN